MPAPRKKSYDQPRQHIKKQRHYFSNKRLSSQSFGFSSSHVWMWELDYKKSWGPKNWCFWTVVLKKTLQSSLDCKDIQPAHPKGNQSWIFIGSTDSEAEIPIVWPPDTKNWLTRKDPDAGKDWRWAEKGMTEDEMVGWHHWRTWVWESSRRWWRTRKPGILQLMGSQRARQDWAIELNWVFNYNFVFFQLSSFHSALFLTPISVLKYSICLLRHSFFFFNLNMLIRLFLNDYFKTFIR